MTEQQLYRKPTRELVLLALHRLGGRVEDKSGRATSQLGVEASTAAVNVALQKLEADGVVRREIRGKRCFAIELVSVNYDRLMEEPDDDDDGQPLPLPIAASVDPHELADELLLRCLEILEGPELARVDAERLGSALEEAARLRERCRRLEDEAEGRSSELTKLRQRVRLLDADKASLQRNLDLALSTNRRTVDAEVDKRIARFMQERPQPGLKSVE